jgi:hypothetical protein
MTIYNQWYTKLTKNEKQLIYIKRLEEQRKEKDHWINEQWTEFCNKPRNTTAHWYNNLSIESKSNLEQSILSKRRDQWALMSSEEKLLEKKRHRIRRENFTPEELEKERQRGRDNVKKLKTEVLSHYSNGTMHCMNPDCEVPGGAKDFYSLCVDHINGGGKKHAEDLKKDGIQFYRWLKKNNLPEGFQTLCFNCNNRKKVINREDYRAPINCRRPYRRKAKEVI